MKKFSILFLVIIVMVIGITGCSVVKENKESDAIRFKKEYENVNGRKVDGSNNVIRYLEIDEDNPFVYVSCNDVISMMDNNETFVVYFGFAKCPWCRSVLPTLIETAKELGLEKIYYVDVSDVRDVLEVDKNGNILTKKEGSEGYLGLIKRLDSVLDDYTLFYDGEEYDTGEKRIYAPNVLSIVNGKPKELETGVSEKQVDPYMELTDQMKKDTYNKFKCVIKCVLEEKGTCSSKNAC